MISNEELATTAKEGTHWHSISMQIAAELLERREESQKTCKWNPMMSDVYETECENTFMLNEGTLRENNMTFCPFCGYKIEETP